jgi:hypothetical protein
VDATISVDYMDMMTAKYSTRLAALLVLLAAASTAQAQLQPATLGDPAAEQYLIRLIEFPDTQGDASVKLQCVAIVKANGRMKDTGCYIKNNWDPDFAQAVEKAAKKAELSPAHTDKKRQTVTLFFQVIFLKTGDERSISVLLNPGIAEMVDAYGKDHISAQRVIGKEKWGKACPSHAKWMVYAKSHVDENGVASSVDLGHGGGIVPTGPCQQALIETITSSQFAPATVDGVAVPSVYMEPFGS